MSLGKGELAVRWGGQRGLMTVQWCDMGTGCSHTEEEHRERFWEGQPPSLTDRGYFEAMTRAIFQAGFNWGVIRKKWPGFRQAFDGFEVDLVADYGPSDVDRLLGDPGIVRNLRKIQATIANARTIQEISERTGSFDSYLRSLPREGDTRVKEMRRLFSGLGDASARFFLFSVGELAAEPATRTHRSRAAS